MPRHEGPFVSCPLCGDPMPATWSEQSRSRPGTTRVYCGLCWFAASSQIIEQLLLADPRGWRERIADEPVRLAGTILDPALERPAAVDPRPDPPRFNGSRTPAMLELLDEPGTPARTATWLDSALGWRHGTARRLLQKALESGEVAEVGRNKKGRMQFTTCRRLRDDIQFAPAAAKVAQEELETKRWAIKRGLLPPNGGEVVS